MQYILFATPQQAAVKTVPLYLYNKKGFVAVIEKSI